MSAERSIAPGTPEPQGLGEDPLLHFTRVYLLFLQGLFKQFPSGSYMWSDSEEDSEITITDQAPIPRDRIEHRPALVTMRGPAQFANMTLDQLRSVNARNGARVHTDLVPCTMTINCIAKQGLEAQRIGWIVMRHIRIFKRLLQRNRIHKVGDEVSISAETAPGSLVSPESDSEAVNVVVSSPFFFQWTESITPLDAPLVTSIEAHMEARLQPQNTFLTKPNERDFLPRPTIRGIPLSGTERRIDGVEPIGTVNATVKT
jgi:hypothetical protein